MRLTDIVSSLDMTVYPIVGLIIFLGVFAAVTVRALRTKQSDIEHFAAIPLDGGEGNVREDRDA